MYKFIGGCYNGLRNENEFINCYGYTKQVDVIPMDYYAVKVDGYKNPVYDNGYIVYYAE